MTYKAKNKIDVLWCNRYCKSCSDNTRCGSYRKGEFKEIFVNLKPKHKKKKKKRVKNKSLLN